MVTSRVAIGRAGLLAAAVLLAGCAHVLAPTPVIAQLPPLDLPAGPLDADDALGSVTTPDLLGLTDEMRAFADRYTRRGHQSQRLQSLHASLRNPGMIGIRYDPYADGTAAQVFERGAANCLSYAHLFVALARYSGLNARYLALSLRPEWSRHGGDRVALRQHVNVLVTLRGGEQFMVDIDPIARDRIASAIVLDDEDAFALYHSNLAMDALLDEDYGPAFGHALRSVALGPRLDYLWVNLGAIYRHAGNDDGAEQAYLAALQLNADSGPAMNNLALLYHSRGDDEQALAWESRITAHRLRNPYFHYYLGQVAEADDDLEAAIGHYRQAIELKDSDAEFYFRLAKVYYAMQRYADSIRLTEEAIARSRLVGERDTYRAFLEQLSGQSLARADTPA